jgi:hypothetical protein
MFKHLSEWEQRKQKLNSWGNNDNIFSSPLISITLKIRTWNTMFVPAM